MESDDGIMWFAFAVFLCSLPISVWAFFRMLIAVNEKLPAQDRLPMWGKFRGIVKSIEVRILYKRFYPHGWLRLVHAITSVLWIVAGAVFLSLAIP